MKTSGTRDFRKKGPGMRRDQTPLPHPRPRPHPDPVFRADEDITSVRLSRTRTLALTRGSNKTAM